MKFKKAQLIPIFLVWTLFFMGCSKSEIDTQQNETITSKEQSIAENALEKVSFDDTNFTMPIEFLIGT